MDAEAVEADLLQRLGVWAAGSVLGGTAAWVSGRRTGRPALAAFGRQNAAWGAVDGAIAAAGAFRRTASDPAQVDAAAAEARAQRLRRTLLVNAWLDVGYLAFGAGLIAANRWAGRMPRYSTAAAVGDGAGIMLQGGFLLLLDTTAARALNT
jgi:hypothetical protein